MYVNYIFFYSYSETT